MDEGSGGVSGRSVYSRVRLTLLSKGQQNLELTGRGMEVNINMSRVIPNFQTLVSRSCEVGSNAVMGHPESWRVEVVYYPKVQVERRALLRIRLDISHSARLLARSIYSSAPWDPS